MSESKALAIRENSIIPTSVDGFADLADRFSKSTLLPDALKAKPADVLVTLMAGHELGLAPMASLRSIHVLKGKPILAADAMVAVVLSSGAAEYFVKVEESDESATYETKRKGAPIPQRATWTVADAKRAGLMANANWTANPRAMCRARAKSILARDVYPDVLAGCYEESERDEIEPRPMPRPAVQPIHSVDADVIDVESEHDAWSSFLDALCPIVEEDTAGWPVERAVAAVKSLLDSAEKPTACDDIMRPVVAALDAGNGDPRIAEVRAALKPHYTARKAALRGKAA